MKNKCGSLLSFVSVFIVCRWVLCRSTPAFMAYFISFQCIRVRHYVKLLWCTACAFCRTFIWRITQHVPKCLIQRRVNALTPLISGLRSAKKFRPRSMRIGHSDVLPFRFMCGYAENIWAIHARRARGFSIRPRGNKFVYSAMIFFAIDTL